MGFKLVGQYAESRVKGRVHDFSPGHPRFPHRNVVPLDLNSHGEITQVIEDLVVKSIIAIKRAWDIPCGTILMAPL